VCDEETALPARQIALRTGATHAGHRRILVVSGDADWTAQQAVTLIAPWASDKTVWLSDRPLTVQTRPLRAATQLLGTEIEILVYDACSGFDPDGFGAATGAIRGGGMLILLTPPLARWGDHLDPQAERIAVWPHTTASVGRRFLRRLADQLRAAPGVTHVRQGLAHPSTPPGIWGVPSIAETGAPPWEPARDPSRPATSDQARAVTAILEVARRPRSVPLVIRAHRGRGKSAALGLAAAQLRAMGWGSILVTAPRADAAKALFKHADAAAAGRADHGPDRDEIITECGAYPATRTAQAPILGGIRFIAPADLVSEKPGADLVLVDEAAGLPGPLLESILRAYPRSVFATTAHGYEGTGRGFDVRFSATLDRLAPGWQTVFLTTPIRWALGDPLEALVARALLLDAEPACPTKIAAVANDEPLDERVDRDTLARDEATLRELFGLLVTAHYQTRPLDLRMALDGPNIRIDALRMGGHLVGTLLAAEEGGFTDTALCDAIYRGERRPRGHLLPQTLSTHAGLIEAPRLRFLRVVRIAVHPACARRGIGRRLLQQLQEDGLAEGMDLLGASFGATAELVQFWVSCGYRPLHIGTRRNAASGEHALVVLRGLTPRGLCFLDAAESRLASRLPVLFAGPLRTLDPHVGAALLGALHREPVRDPQLAQSAGPSEERELDGFVEGHRSLHATLPLLAERTRRHLGACLRAGRIDLEDAALLIAATCQLRSTAELVAHFRSSGRDALLARLRRAAAQLRPAAPVPDPRACR
jgi:tRNA(Met) cytidine acetyltransferase